jgi:hypothetical protein
MPKGQKHHWGGGYIRTIVCPECDKIYRSSNVKMVNKLMRLHLKTAHNSTIRGDVEKIHNPIEYHMCYGLDHDNKNRKIKEEQFREKAVLSR